MIISNIHNRTPKSGILFVVRLPPVENRGGGRGVLTRVGRKSFFFGNLKTASALCMQNSDKKIVSKF